jgi:hypothetical protein
MGVNQAAVSQLFHDHFCAGQAQSNVPGQSGRGHRLKARAGRDDRDGMDAESGVMAEGHRWDQLNLAGI